MRDLTRPEPISSSINDLPLKYIIVFLRNKTTLSKTISPHCMLVLLQITYYVLRRDRPEEWKCQPYHWLPKDLEIHEMCVGAFSLAIGSFISSTMACWIMNGGWTSIYFDHKEHGYLWLLLQTPLVFIWQVKPNFSLESNFIWRYLRQKVPKFYH